MHAILEILKEFASISAVIQVLVLTVAVYYILSLFRRTRSAQMLKGLAIVILLVWGASRLVRLEVLGWLAKNILIYAALAFLVVFQPEIRQTLLNVGRRWNSSSHSLTSLEAFVEQLADVVFSLSRTKTGALVAIERRVHLDDFCGNGTLLNAPFVPRLLASIFYHGAPLHDGGVILRGEMIVAARCVFPLSEKEDIGHGMRHRAALGLSEQTDAVVVVVSEETGDVSIAYQGRIMPDLTPTHLRRYLKLLLPKEGLADALRHAIDEIELERNPDASPSPPDGTGSAESEKTK